MTSAFTLRTLRCAVVLSMWAAGVSAWAQGAEPADGDWRHEKIVRVVPLSALPAHVDTHCLDAPGAEKPEAAIVLRFRVGRAHYYQAYPVTPDREWKPGDAAAFIPRTCDIRPYVEP